MRNLIIIGLLLGGFLHGFAQEVMPLEVSSRQVMGKHTIKYSIGSLMDRNIPAIQFGVERNLGVDRSISQELGYVFRSPFFLWQKGASGQTEFRYYTKSKNTQLPVDTYVGLLSRYWITNIVDDGIVERGNGEYNEFMRVNTQTSGISLNTTLGIKRMMFRSPFSIDLGCAVGAMYATNRPDLPEDLAEQDRNGFVAAGIWNPFAEFSRWQVDFSLQLKLGYNLK